MYKNEKFVTHLTFLQGLRVLVVDNNVDCCDTIDLLLQPYGIEVRKAFLAQQALKIFVEWQPDILVGNIALPDIDGFALVRQAKTIATKRGKVFSAIAAGACISEEMRQLALSSGFDFWFTKPIDFNDFVTVLAYLVIYQSSSPIVQRTMINPVKMAI